MRLFFDSNVWISAFAMRGFCADVLEITLQHAEFELWTSGAVVDEVMHTLQAKFILSEQAQQRASRIFEMAQRAPTGDWTPPGDFPDPDDVPILSAALVAEVDAFVTGDKALLGLGEVQGMPLITPRDAYQRLRGLT